MTHYFRGVHEWWVSTTHIAQYDKNITLILTFNNPTYIALISSSYSRMTENMESNYISEFEMYKWYVIEDSFFYKLLPTHTDTN